MRDAVYGGGGEDFDLSRCLDVCDEHFSGKFRGIPNLRNKLQTQLILSNSVPFSLRFSTSLGEE